MTISDDQVLNTEVECIKVNQKAHPKTANKSKKKPNKFQVLIEQFQTASIELHGPILHRRAHSAQLHKVLQDASFTATQLCPINTLNRVDHIQVLRLLYDIREMPTFPYSIPKKIKEKFEEKVVLVPDVEHPLLKENNFGATSMNGELLSSECPIGIAADDCNDFILHLRCTHCKYKWVHSIIFKFDSGFGTGYNIGNRDDVFTVLDDAVNLVNHIYDCSNLLRDVGYVPNPVPVCFNALVYCLLDQDQDAIFVLSICNLCNL